MADTYYASFIQPIIGEVKKTGRKAAIKVFSCSKDVRDSHHFDVDAEQLEKILQILERK